MPSVTTILEAYPKGAAYFQWLKSVGEDADTVRDEAGRRGSIVHAMTEQYDRGEVVNLVENGGIAYKLGEWAMFERYVEFRSRVNLTYEHVEQTIISKDLGYAGTIDRVAVIDGVRYLIDIKTSNAIYNSYWLQLAAYDNLLGNTCDKFAILWLNAKTRTEGKKGAIQGAGWQLVVRDELAKEQQLFKCTHELWKAENEGMKPREMSYKISYQLPC